MGNKNDILSRATLSDRMRLALMERALREIALELSVVDRPGAAPWTPQRIAEETLKETGAWSDER